MCLLVCFLKQSLFLCSMEVGFFQTLPEPCLAFPSLSSSTRCPRPGALCPSAPSPSERLLCPLSLPSPSLISVLCLLGPRSSSLPERCSPRAPLSATALVLGDIGGLAGGCPAGAAAPPSPGAGAHLQLWLAQPHHLLNCYFLPVSSSAPKRAQTFFQLEMLQISSAPRRAKLSAGVRVWKCEDSQPSPQSLASPQPSLGCGHLQNDLSRFQHALLVSMEPWGNLSFPRSVLLTDPKW